MTQPPPAAVPASLTARALAPDLARGFMLLAIALAHAPAFVGDWERGPAALNAIAKLVKSLLLDNQARNMFVFLFGYGLVQLAQRKYPQDRDFTSLRRLLRLRGLWLIVIGFANTVLLVPFDVIALYGLTLLVLAPLVRARDSVLLWTSVTALIPATLMLAWQSVIAHVAAAAGSPITMARYMEPDFGAHVIASIPLWPVKTILGTVTVVPGMLAGIWAARRRILDEPERHASSLRRVTTIFIGVSVIGRLPAALLATGVWATTSTPVTWAAAIAHNLTGYAGGIGMTAAVGLVTIRIGHDHGRFTVALAALGQRSLTFYLFQSVVWLVLFYPFTLGLWDDMGFAATFGIATGVWVASIALAEWMRRAGYRGPAEVLLRRLSFRRPI